MTLAQSATFADCDRKNPIAQAGGVSKRGKALENINAHRLENVMAIFTAEPEADGNGIDQPLIPVQQFNPPLWIAFQTLQNKSGIGISCCLLDLARSA